MKPIAAMRLRAADSGGGGGATYLDELATLPHAVLSLRKLISTATNAVRVRRSSDNAEQDIGFSGDDFDTASLTSFVGSDSAYVVKFYDQTGNGKDLSQATTSRQPRIVNAGTFDGFARFDGTAHGMSIVTPTFGTPYAGIYRKVALPGTYSGNPMQYELSADFATTANTFGSFYSPEGGKLWSVQSNSGGVKRYVYSPAYSTLVQNTILYDTSASPTSDEIRQWTAGTLDTPHAATSTAQSGNYRSDRDLFIACRNNSSLFCRMDLETLVLYNADTSALRTSIETIVS